jgi:hypothetical protein
MANLLNQNIGTNYKGILNLNTLNGNLSGTLQAVTDGDGNASLLQLSTASVSFGGSTKLNWDNANTRLGIGTNTPAGILHLKTAAATTRLLLDGDAAQNKIITYRTAGVQRFGLYTNNTSESGANEGSDFAIRAYSDTGTLLSTPIFIKRSTGFVGIGTTSASARLHVMGGGTSSGTTALLVQNSAGNPMFSVRDDRSLALNCFNQLCINSTGDLNFNGGFRFLTQGSGKIYFDGWSEGTTKATNYAVIFGSRGNNTGNSITNSATQENGNPFVFGFDSHNSSAIVQINSTTRGFLPPRMTTTQKNAIATPASGLVVYDSTLNKLAVYTGSAWETVTSI